MTFLARRNEQPPGVRKTENQNPEPEHIKHQLHFSLLT
jgi:hypothetical protein